MKQVILLRAAAIIGFLYFVGHSMGYPWLPTDKISAAAIAKNIKYISFSFSGQLRSLWDFYTGFGIIISVALMLKSACLWLLSNLIQQKGSSLAPILSVFLAAYLINAWLSWKYFFYIPVVFALVISLLVASTIAIIKRNERQVS